MPTAGLYQSVEDALIETDPGRKCDSVAKLLRCWNQGELPLDRKLPVLDFDQPGRPDLPRLIDPRKLGRRTTSNERGRAILLHAFTHIEFNAINIALDAVYRYRNMPVQFTSDWLSVASEEARHFSLLSQDLIERGSFYGEFDAHDGLWDMVCRTRHDVLHRMALVPRVMEARGLDVSPGIIDRFKQVGDQNAVDILEVIYRDEIGHVRIGNHWYHYLCELRELDSAATFRSLVDEYLKGKLRGPFNWPARLEAGFEESELKALERSFN